MFCYGMNCFWTPSRIFLKSSYSELFSQRQMCKFRAFENERETARGRRTDYDMVTVTRVENAKTVEIQARPAAIPRPGLC